MLDYAANGVVYWPAERLQLDFENRRARDDDEPDKVGRASVGEELDPSGSGMT